MSMTSHSARSQLASGSQNSSQNEKFKSSMNLMTYEHERTYKRGHHEFHSLNVSTSSTNKTINNSTENHKNLNIALNYARLLT